MNEENIRALVSFILCLVILITPMFLFREKKEEGDGDRVGAVQSITIDAFFVAILLILTFVPNLGFIAIGPVSLTLLHLPVLLGAALFGWKRGLFYGLMFGTLSWIKALIGATTVLDVAFQHVYIAVLPRLLFGLVSGIVFSLIRKLHKKGPKSLYYALAAFFLTCLHTVLVFLFLGLFEPWVRDWLFNPQPIIAGTGISILIFLSIGMSGEALLGAILTPTLEKVLTKAVPMLRRKESPAK